MLAQPGKQFAFAAGDGGVLGQVRVAVDQPGKNGDDWPRSIHRTDLSALHSPQIVVIADLGDASIFDNDGAASPAAKRAEFRGID